MKAVMNLSDRTYVLNDGKLIATGTPQSVVADPTVIEAHFGHGAAKAMAVQGSMSRIVVDSVCRLWLRQCPSGCLTGDQFW